MTDQPIKIDDYPDTMKAVGAKSRNTLKRLMDEEGFPRPYEILKNKKGFARHEVQAWLRDRMTAQRGVAA